MPIQSLAEAKAALEKEEVVAAAENPEDAPVVDDAPTDEPKPEDDPDSDPPADDPDASLSDAPPADWMKGDDDPDPQPDPDKLPDSQAAQIRRKYQSQAKEAKAELAEKESEIQRLKGELAKGVTKPAVTTTPKPERKDFRDDGAYQEAVARWVVQDQQARFTSEQRAAEQKRKLEETKAKVAEDVDRHYVRISALAEKSKISPDACKAADYAVRAAVDAVRPGDGDTIVDALIHLVGPGSERVIYKIGVSKAHREKLVELVKEDPSFVKVGIYLGRLNAELSAPARRESKAPDPAPRLQGDKAGGSAGVKERKEYDAAIAAGQTQRAWNIKRAAQAKKISTSSW